MRQGGDIDRNDVLPKPSEMTADERLAKARELLSHLLPHAEQAIKASEMTAHFVYTDKVNGRIPPSRHASGYAVLREALFESTTISVAALWDKFQEGTVSVPSILEYLNHPDVIKLVEESVRSNWANRVPKVNGSDPETENALVAYFNSRTERQAAIVKRDLERLVKFVAGVQAHSTFEAVQNARNKHLGHNLLETRAERAAAKAGRKVPKMRYGQERKLLRKALVIIERLIVMLEGTSYDLRGEYTINAKRVAEDFWSNLEFKDERSANPTVG